VTSAFGASDATSTAVWYGCAGVSSGMTSIGVWQERAKSRDTGTLLLFVGLGLAGALVGTRPSFELLNLIAKSLICIAVLGLILPLSLRQEEGRAMLARLGAALGRS
jgi:uncharacterized membrane protein HdeD (DUF308 family)